MDSAAGDKRSTLEIFGFFSNGEYFHLGPKPQLWRASGQINPRQQQQHSTIIHREIFHGRKFSRKLSRCWIFLPVKWNSNAAKLISTDPNSIYSVLHFENTTEIGVCLTIFTNGFIDNLKIKSTEGYHNKGKIGQQVFENWENHHSSEES